MTSIGPGGANHTQPQSIDSEAPLDAAAVDLFLSNLGPDMVLVGGQALSFWMDRFGISSNGMAISNDGDALGRLSRAVELAHAIKARLVPMPPEARTSLVAQLRLPAAGGKERNIDVLHMLFTVEGLRKSREFTKRVVGSSLSIEWKPGAWMKVMDPFDVLESRVQNAVGLIGEKGEHVLTQARWAILVAHHALMRLAEDKDSQKRLGFHLQRLHRFARSQSGRRLLNEYGIELLDAVDTDAIASLSPSHQLQLDAIESLRRERSAKSIKRAASTAKQG